MKFKKLFGNWTNAIKTFPISHILLLILTITLIGENEGLIYLNSYFFKSPLRFALILTFIISCYGPLFLIHSEIKNKNQINKILQIGSIIIGGLYYILLNNIDGDNINFFESLLYTQVFLLALLGIPLIIALLHKENEQKIRFSRTNLIISIILGGIAGGIIRGGISGALATIKSLFGIYIDFNIYSDIGFISEILLAGSFIFNFYITFTENISSETDFEINPSRLRKVFGSFILLPLAIIYLLIFLAYRTKVLITGIRTEGKMIWLGIGYFTLGIFSLYLIYPEKNKSNELINKILHISFILSAFIMIRDVAKIINEYGIISISTGFVCYIIIFIITISILSFILTNKRLLSFISTLTILSFIAAYLRPINVGHISFISQKNRLEDLLSKENISIPLTEGALKNTNEESTRLIMGVIDGLIDNFNEDKIINKFIDYKYHEYESSSWSSYYKIREFLGVSTNDYNYNYNYYYPTYKYRYYNQNSKTQRTNVSGFSKFYNFETYHGNVKNMILKLEIDNQKYEFDLSNYIEELKEKADIYERSDLNEDEKNTLQKPALILKKENYKLVITGFSMEENEEGELSFNNIKGYILIK